jgi:hypothetical protein
MTPAEFILTFAIGGLGLRALVGWLKEKTGAQGFLALLLTLACCAAACAIYILVAPMFGLEVVTWSGFLFLLSEVFVGTQLWYRATK